MACRRHKGQASSPAHRYGHPRGLTELRRPRFQSRSCHFVRVTLCGPQFPRLLNGNSNRSHGTAAGLHAWRHIKLPQPKCWVLLLLLLFLEERGWPSRSGKRREVEVGRRGSVTSPAEEKVRHSGRCSSSSRLAGPEPWSQTAAARGAAVPR